MRRAAAARRKTSRRTAAAGIPVGLLEGAAVLYELLHGGDQAAVGLGLVGVRRPLVQRVVQLLAGRPDVRARDVRERRGERRDARPAVVVDGDQAQLVAAPPRRDQVSGKHCDPAGGRW